MSIPPAQLTVDSPLEPDSKGMFVGQNAYFVGFPYGMDFAQTYDTLPDVFGFVKRATVAQFDGFLHHIERAMCDGCCSN